MLRQLADYYKEKKIAALNFACDYEKSCKGDNENFTTAREAFVGSKYEGGSPYPRILFISLDPGEEWSPEENTLEAVRGWEENKFNIESVIGKEKSRHWYRTHELTWIILQKFKPDIKIGEVKPYFAHTNSAKCSQNKESSKKADRRLFDNCRRFIPDEVILLEPDVIITQGDEAHLSIKNSLKPIESKEFANYYFELPNAKKVLCFPTYHPRSWGHFNQQRREEFHNYADLVYKLYSTDSRPSS